MSVRTSLSVTGAERWRTQPHEQRITWNHLQHNELIGISSGWATTRSATQSSPRCGSNSCATRRYTALLLHVMVRRGPRCHLVRDAGGTVQRREGHVRRTVGTASSPMRGWQRVRSRWESEQHSSAAPASLMPRTEQAAPRRRHPNRARPPKPAPAPDARAPRTMGTPKTMGTQTVLRSSRETTFRHHVVRKTLTRSRTPIRR